MAQHNLTKEIMDVAELKGQTEDIEEAQVAETKLDIEKVQTVINDKDITYGHIVRFADLSKGAIRPYRTGERAVTKMQIENALKLQELYEEFYKEEIKMENIKKMNWKEFMDLDEVQTEASTPGYGLLAYNDGEVSATIEFKSKDVDESGHIIEDSEGHDDFSLWEDEELAKELQQLVIDEYAAL